MNLLENNNRNFVIALIFVICAGVVGSVLYAGLITRTSIINLGILVQVLQYLAIWAFITVIPPLIFHYAPIRTEFNLKQFSIYVGLSLIPFLAQNILKPILESTLTDNLCGVWDLDIIRQSTSSWIFL